MSAHADSIVAGINGTVGNFTLNVALEAPMRGITALFGPSGCGKTTILRCIAGLTRLPGRISVGGTPWQDDEHGIFAKPHEREIGYVFQEPSLFSHLNVRKNLLYGFRRAGRRAGRHAERRGASRTLPPEEVIGMLGVGHLLDRSPAALSGGERQRVAVGRALLSQPSVLLMDEPLSALDQRSKEEILPYFDSLHRSLSIPIVYVTHSVTEVAQLADRIILFSEGRHVAAGSVFEMVQRFDLRPSAGRRDAGTTVVATIAAHDAGYQLTRLDLDGQAIFVPLIDVRPGERIRLRVDAEDVALATRRPENTSIRNTLSGRVAEIRDEPGTAFTNVAIGIGEARIRAVVTRKAADDLSLTAGMPVFALIKSLSFDGFSNGPGAMTATRAA